MIEKLRALVYERAALKFDIIPESYKERIELELKKIEEREAERDILFIEKFLSVGKELDIPTKVHIQELETSLVCYLLEISTIDPIEANLSFVLPEDFEDGDISMPLYELDKMVETFMTLPDQRILSVENIEAYKLKYSKK